MQIVVTYDQAVNTLPAGFVSAINYVVNYFDSLFTNNVTINIDVGYGTIQGQPLQPGVLGESYAPQYLTESYSAARNALLAQGAPGASSLPTTSPLSGTLDMAQAEAQALGLTSAVSTSYVGFANNVSWSYGVNVTPPSNAYYFIGTVEHEFTEDMGRVSLLDGQPSYYALMDLFRYSSPGSRDLRTGGAGSTAYFSIDNGNTNLGTWNNHTSNGDLADWYPSGPAANGNDALNDYSYSGVVNAFSANDLTLMQALGWTTAPPPPPDLTAYLNNGSMTATAGSSINLQVWTDNLGNGPAPASTTAIYLSTTSTINPGSDTLLGTLSIPALAAENNGAWYIAQNDTLTLPDNLTPGTYYVGAYADYNGMVTETNETNNNNNVVQVTVGSSGPPDLTAYLNNSSMTVSAGSNVTLQTWTDNLGTGVAGASTTAIYLSTTPTINPGSDTLLGTVSVPALAAENNTGWYNAQNNTVTLPSNLAPGTYYIGAYADYNGTIAESNENNNNYNVVQVTVTAAGQPDLTAYLNNSSMTASQGSNVTLQTWTDNLGSGPAPASTTAIYLSTTSTINPGSDTLLGTFSAPALAAYNNTGWYTWQNDTVTLPSNLTPGTYYLGAYADYNGTIVESNNNYNVVQVTVTAAGQPDLTAYLNNSSMTAARGSNVTLQTWTDNLGSGPAPASTTAIYLSTTSTINPGSDTLLGTFSAPALAAYNNTGWYTWQNDTVTLPSNLAPGTYYLGAYADYNGTIVENNNNYNVVQVTVTTGGSQVQTSMSGSTDSTAFEGGLMGARSDMAVGSQANCGDGIAPTGFDPGASSPTHAPGSIDVGLSSAGLVSTPPGPGSIGPAPPSPEFGNGLAGSAVFDPSSTQQLVQAMNTFWPSTAPPQPAGPSPFDGGVTPANNLASTWIGQHH